MTKTPSAEARERRATVYNHPSSVARRAEESRGPAKGPKVDLRRRQLDEIESLGARHYREGQELRARHNCEIAQEVEPRGNLPSLELEQQRKWEVEELHRKHERERAAMLRRHDAEREKMRAQPSGR
jgi:hypothetical protein